MGPSVRQTDVLRRDYPDRVLADVPTYMSKVEFGSESC